MSTKWDCETTIKFIQEYKSHECLWDFKSVKYKNRPMRAAAYLQIVEEMNLTDFGVPEAKNKIKNLRSTYSQEMKKYEDSKKSSSGVDDVYESNIKWLKELEYVYKDADDRRTPDIGEQSPKEPMKRTKNFLPLSPNVPKKKPKMGTNLDTCDLMKACGIALAERKKHDVEEHEATGINVAKKLQRMDPLQAIYAESIINAALRRGLLKTLEPHTDICDNQCNIIMAQGPFRERTPSSPARSADSRGSFVDQDTICAVTLTE